MKFKLTLAKVDVSYATNRRRKLWSDRTTSGKELRNHSVKPADVEQGKIKLKSQQQITRKHMKNGDLVKKLTPGT